MKKIVVAILVLAMSLILVSCGEEKSPLDMLKDKISYEETAHLVGNNDVLGVEVISIKGEKAPMLDGKVSTLSDRTEVRVSLKNLDKVPAECKVKLIGADKTAEVTLPKDVLGMSYCSSVDREVMDFIPSEIVILGEEGEMKIELASVTKDSKMDIVKALEIAYTSLESDIATYFDTKEFLGEVVVKLIHSHKVEDSPYYYYVAFVKGKDEYVACLIDPASEKIVNTKKK